MPALAVGLLEVFRRWRRLRAPARAAALAVIAVSLTVQVVGAAVSYDQAGMFKAMLRAHPPVAGAGFLADATRPSTEAAIDRVEFDWRYFPVTEEAGDLLRGQHLAGRLLRRLVGRRPD
jgi:hypothetical protein